MQFLDEVKIHITSGAGGAGCLSFRRERNEPRGGPNGGNGGRGGSVIVEATDDLNTLIDYRYRRHFKAAAGGRGEGSLRTGANGADKILPVPVGTQVIDAESDMVLADLDRAGARAVLALGGEGGLGNAHFKSSTNRAPRRADPGEPAIARWVVLRLKLLSDAGLVGLPNAGKSTFLAAVSRARPKIADYPFTTLEPRLGVVTADDDSFVLADIPGLIEGAHAGAGLGVRFLGHIERCALLIHLVDATAEDVAASYRAVRQELEAYGHGLAEKNEIVCLNKCDALTDEERSAQLSALSKAAGSEPFVTSGVAGEGLDAVCRIVLQHVVAARQARKVADEDSAA
jgi:GTP-binding protein